MDDYILFYPESDRFPDLALRHCGYEECVPGHSYGPAVRSVYLIHIIIRGQGTFLANQQTFHLGAGDGFLIVPEMQTYYRADEKDPWTYCWVAFMGNRAEDVLRELFDSLDLTLGFFEYALAGSTVRSFLTWLKKNGMAEAFFEGNRLLWRAV